MNGNKSVPNMGELNQYKLTIEGYEASSQSLYDIQAYAAAGQSTLSFFAVPNGQSSKTLSDTNMELAGQLPANKKFLITSVEVVFYPTRPSVTADMPAAFGGAQQAAELINDVYVVACGGNLVLTVGSKTYLQEAPLGRLPAKTHFHLDAALADVTTAGAGLQSRIAYGYAAGRAYGLRAPLLLEENMNFGVSLNWPEGVVALPSGNPGRIGVVLDGLLYRKAQ
jgi:hypothetical protein